VAVFDGGQLTYRQLDQASDRPVPIGNAVRISIAILSYLDGVSFDVTADYDSVPDLDVFAAGIGHALDELG
jgi:WS/DGAT C-terminal domain